MPSAPRRRPLRLTGNAALERWGQLAKDEDYGVVTDALMSIADGSWVDRYEHYQEVTEPDGQLLWVRPDLVIVWRVITEYPDWYRLIHVGDPDDYDF